MTRSLCLCRKISKGWVSVQCPDVLVTVTEGRYYLMGGRGRQDSSHAMVPCSRAAFTKLQGMRERQPWLLASLCSWRTSSQRGLLPWGAPRNGARGSVSGTDLAEPPGREASQRQASPLTKYLHISEIIFKIFPVLLTSRPFPHHCLKVCTIYCLFVSCFHKGRSCSENETEGAIIEGFRGVCLVGRESSILPLIS